MVLIMVSVVVMFCVCEFGQRVNGHFETFDNEVGQCRWYLFPLELQQMLVIATMNTQQPVMIQGFGNIPCTRESFKMVKKSEFVTNLSFQFFLILMNVISIFNN